MMGTESRVQIFFSCLIICLQFFVPICVVSSIEPERTLAISEPIPPLQLSHGVVVENSPGLKPGTAVLCERVRIHGLSRIHHLKKLSHSANVKVVSKSSSPLHPTKFEVCFHRNSSIGICMCPPSQWEKVVKGSWLRPMSPFDHKLIDIRTSHASSESLLGFEVSVEEEFYLYRVILLGLGLVLLTSASFLSKSLIFYYSSAMAVGIILVILMVLFQGMRLLPTGRRSSLAIFLYSFVVGLGSFLLRYLPGLLHSILSEMGVSEDMYYPLAIFLLAFMVLCGAWLGFWAVEKLILTKDGSVDIATSNFVAWSIRIFASLMILQCSLDPLLAAEALIIGIVTSALLKKVFRSRFFRRLCRKLFASSKDSHRRFLNTSPPPLREPYTEGTRTSHSSPASTYSPLQGYYSTFHNTPERRRYSKEEWKQFTEDYTKKSLEGLVSSPEFSKWAASRADKITLRNTDESSSISDRIRKWLPGF